MVTITTGAFALLFASSVLTDRVVQSPRLGDTRMKKPDNEQDPITEELN